MTPTTVGRAGDVLPRGFLVAAGALVVVLFALPLVLGTPLLDPDEGLHAAIAQEMVERGDWVTPRFLGEPFLDKPILFFWSLAASIAAFGSSDVAVKLPGLAFGLLGALATGLLAGRLFGKDAGRLAAVFQATLLLPAAHTEAAVHDVALVPCTTAALLCLWNASTAARTRQTLAWGAAAGVCLGFAILTKAATGVALIGLPFALWALVQRRLTPALVAAGAVSLVVAVAIAVPWYRAMEAANPGYLHYYFVERHLLGFTTDTQLHGLRPWWFYLPVLAGGGLPWVAYAIHARRGGDTGDRAARALVWTWLVIDVAFLSAAGSKLQTYVLPAFPAVATLAAVAWRDRLAARPSTWTPGWRASHVCAALAMAAILPVTVYVAERLFAVPFGPWAWMAAGACALGWLVIAAAPWRYSPAATLALTAWGLAGLAAVAFAGLLPVLAPSFTAREAARYFNAKGALPRRVLFYDQRVGSFVFYLSPALRAGVDGERLAHASPELVLSLRQAPPDTVILIGAPDYRRLERRLPLRDEPSVVAGHFHIFEAGDFVHALHVATGR